MDLFAPSLIARPLETKALSVSQLIFEVKSNLESQYREVLVIGEVSSFKAWRSGHWYFDLKDDKSVLPAVMFKFHCSKVKFEMQDGMQVLVTGRVSVYAPQSKVQIIAESIEPVGAGALALAFEQLKKKLEQEGLFDAKHKKALPVFPLRIGIVTSPQGAAIRDMLRILNQRMSKVHVLIAPVRVQGQGSAQEISEAIYKLDATQSCDVIIVGRGGGSLEDLWSFNEEAVARAIFACKTPIVSAVGHETDFSIADFVADIRCATPTHAAQLVVPDINDIVAQFEAWQKHLHRSMKALVYKNQLHLEKTAKRIKEPRLILFQLMQRVDEASMKLERGFRNLFHKRKQLHEELQKRLLRFPFEKKCVLEQKKLETQVQKMQAALAKSLKSLQERTALFEARLLSLSPLAVLARGYTLLYKRNEKGEMKVISKTSEAVCGEILEARLSDGVIKVKVE